MLLTLARFALLSLAIYSGVMAVWSAVFSN